MKKIKKNSSIKKKQIKKLEEQRGFLKDIYGKLILSQCSRKEDISAQKQAATSLCTNGQKLDGELGSAFIEFGNFKLSVEEFRQQLSQMITDKIDDPIKEILNICKETMSNKKDKESDNSYLKLDLFKITIIEKIFECLMDYKNYYQSCMNVLDEVISKFNDIKQKAQNDKDNIIKNAVDEGDVSEEGEKDSPKSFVLFGTELTRLVANDDTQIPRLIQHLVTYILTHAVDRIGIFRVAGDKKTVAEVKKDLDAYVDVNFAYDNNGHIAATLFKMFFRSLPNSLTCFDLFDAWITVMKGDDEEVKKNEFKAIISMMPIEHQRLLDYVIAFCNKVAMHSNVNMMNHKNLASLIAPNIMYRKEVNLETVLDESNTANEVVEFLMMNYDELFENVSYDIKGENVTYETKRETVPLFNLGIGHFSSNVFIGVPGIVSLTDISSSQPAKKNINEKRKKRREKKHRKEKTLDKPVVPQEKQPDPRRFTITVEEESKMTKHMNTSNLANMDPSELIKQNPNLSALIDDSGSVRGLLRRTPSSAPKSKKFDSVEINSSSGKKRKKRRSKNQETKRSESFGKTIVISNMDDEEVDMTKKEDDSNNGKEEVENIIENHALDNSNEMEKNNETENNSEMEKSDEKIDENIDDEKIKEEDNNSQPSEDNNRKSLRLSSSTPKKDESKIKYRIDANMKFQSNLKLKDVDAINEAINQIFGLNELSLGYIILGYDTATSIQLECMGKELDEIVNHFKDDEVQYCLLRLPIPNDANISSTTRDVFIEWNGPHISNLQKGLKKSHVGDVKRLLHPYHTELLVLSKSSFNLETILDKSNPQNNSHVID